MTLNQMLKDAHTHRKNVAHSNERVRTEIIEAIREAQFENRRWAFAIYPDEPMANANRVLHVTYETTRLYDNKTVKLHYRLVVHDGGKVSISDENHTALDTAASAEHALSEVARLIAEFEWPNELPTG